MDDLSATRVEPSGAGTDIEKRSPANGQPRKRPTPEKPEESSESPSVDEGDPIEEIHQIDELA